VDGPLEAILHGDVAGGEVEEDLGDEQGRDLLISLPHKRKKKNS
jgi:hypothetical protein